MDRATRSELVVTVEALKEKLQKYERKLRDVIQAYKGLTKEKDALEATVKVFTANQISRTERSNRPDRDLKTLSSDSEQTDDEKSFSDPLGSFGSREDDARELETYKDQIVTLSSSFATLSEEKSKLDSNYLAEKKQNRQEHEELQKKFDDQRENRELKERVFQEQIQDLKIKVRSQQQDREKEQTDHSIMLKELQKLVAQERATKEIIENQLDDAVAALRDKENAVPSVSEKYEKKIQDLSNELQVVRNRMKAAEEKAKEPSPFVLDLQKEMSELKAQHSLQVQQERKRVITAEGHAVEVSQQSEERISSLESKLSELSEVVGDYERLRYQDQCSIHRLKERVTQLDLENTALAQATHGTDPDRDHDEGNLDAPALVNKITRLKALLKAANQRSEKPIDIEALLDETSENKKHRDELDHLKEEFERYKLRAASVLKNKSGKEQSNTKEVDCLKEQVSELREKQKILHYRHEDELERLKQKEEDLRKTIISLQERHKMDVSQMQLEYQQQVRELEHEVKKQRERTVSMLAEKDRDMQTIRSTYSYRMDSDYSLPNRDVDAEHVDQDFQPLFSKKHSVEEVAVSKLLHMPSNAQGEATLLHFANEQARKDGEIVNVRKQKRQLEIDFRELQQTANMKEGKYLKQIESLHEEIHRTERAMSREGANLEYLKNVVYKFLISSDKVGKRRMLNAIMTILEFSPQERDKVDVYMASWFG